MKNFTDFVMNDYLAYLVNTLLSRNNISIDKSELKFQIKSHPSYPSLHAITGVLNHFNIDNLALNIPKNEETLAHLPQTFLAQINSDKGEEFVVVTKKGVNYQLIDTSKKKTIASIREFLKQFTGIIVGIEKTKDTNEIKNSNLLYKILIPVAILLVISLLLLIKPSLTNIFFLTTSILGLYISYTIKKQEQGQETVIGNAFCSGESEKKDCNAVLTSKGATLIGSFKLSDLSIVYFITLTTSVASLIIVNHNLFVIYIITLLSMPITIYSLYYQASVIKKWCFLCLCIVSILWVQVSLLLTNLLNFDYNQWIIPALLVLSILLITLIFYSFLSPKLDELNILKNTKAEFYKFKRNFNLFETLLQKSETLNTINDKAFKGITIGNRDAEVKIVVITNPFCGHCRPVHTLVEDIFKKYSKKVAIQIYFNVNPKNTNNPSVQVVTRLLELYHNTGLESCMIAMHKIYKNQDLKLWLEEFDDCSNYSYYSSVLEKQYSWCVYNSIHFTPEILVNRKLYPNEYDRSDLLLFIEDMYESSCVNTTEFQLTT